VAAQGDPETLFRDPGTERLRSFLGRFHQVFR
jgi:ABC-type histidine transport system ATPase subunit